MNSETDKHRQTTVPFLKGNGCDIGSGGDPVVPECVSIDLPQDEYAHYNSDHPHRGQINFRGSAVSLPFKNNTLDWVYSSHLLEDFPLEQWMTILAEWIRVIKPGGVLVILIPDKERWNEALRKGQPPNCSHRHEGHVGELSDLTSCLEMTPIRDELLSDYSILFVGRKN